MSIATEAVQAYYEKARRPKFNPAEFRLSESGDCRRKRVLKAMGVDPTHTAPEETFRTMETGHLWENWLVERIRERGLPVATQVVVETPYGASGHIDAVVVTDAGKLIVECKAVSQWAKDLPDARHVQQVQAYLHFYGRQRGITQAEIVYIHRENGAGPFPYPVEYDPEAGAAIEAELRELRAHVERKDPPQIPDGMAADKFPCYYKTRQYEVHCPFWGHCWAPPVEKAGA